MKDGTDRFEQYYVRFFREVYCYFLTSIQNEFQAEEMAQEVFVKLWRISGKYSLRNMRRDGYGA